MRAHHSTQKQPPAAAAAAAAAAPAQKQDMISPVSVCSYNIKMLPFEVATSERLHSIVSELQTIDADVFCLQECFAFHAVRTIREALRPEYKYCCSHVRNIPFYNTHSGLMILSRFPLKKVHYERFSHHTFVDSLAHKGFICCEVIAPSHRLVLCNTHLQADYQWVHCQHTRSEQLQQLFRYVKKAYVESKRARQGGWPIMLCGDWNIPLNNRDGKAAFVAAAKGGLPVPHHIAYGRRGLSQRGSATNEDGLLDYFLVCPQTCGSSYSSSTVSVHTSPSYTFSDHKWILLSANKKKSRRTQKRRPPLTRLLSTKQRIES
jgi:endonuclease/exonuclease/phosphatase family metal-dependent hydrolase